MYKCKQCGKNTIVKDSTSNNLGIVRRRQCLGCLFKFSTQEFELPPFQKKRPEEKIYKIREQKPIMSKAEITKRKLISSEFWRLDRAGKIDWTHKEGPKYENTYVELI